MSVTRGECPPYSPGDGQGLVEYGLILGLSAVVALVVLVVFGAPLADILAALGDAIDG